MSRRFAHKSKKELEDIRDTPTLNTVQSSRNAGSTHEITTHTLTNNPSVDQIEAVAELHQRELEENVQKLLKPHWTLVPIFWITLVSLLIALLAYFRPTQPVVQDNQHTLSSSPTITTPQNSSPISSPKKSVSQNKPVREKP